MNRNLLTQIKNEWRDNLWLVIELTVVSVAIWILAFTLYNAIRPRFEEKGFDCENVYKISIKTLDTESPEYVDMGEETENNNINDIRMLLGRIRKSPYVEAAGLSCNAIPYQLSYSGNRLEVEGKGDSVYYNGNLRMGSPEIARVLRLKSREGLSVEKVEEILRKGEILVSNCETYELTGLDDVKDLVGGTVMFMDTVNAKRIGGVIESIKRNEYETLMGTIFVPINESDNKQINYCGGIGLRVKPGMGKKFEEEFYSTADMRRLRNVYLTQLSDMKSVRKANQYHNDTQVRLWTSGIVFLLVIIFLGLLGTFWFRIRQRSGEIALRKTCGATSGDIFRRTIGEGLLLLAMSILPAIALEWVINKNFHLVEDNTYWTAAVFALIFSIVIMVLMIIAGIAFPARKAMKIEPAIALKEE